MNWSDIKKLEGGATVHVEKGQKGEDGTRRREKDPWESDEVSGARGSAEEQFETVDKEWIMSNHREEMGDECVDSMVDMDVKDMETMLMKCRETMTGVTGVTGATEDGGFVEYDVDGGKEEEGETGNAKHEKKGRDDLGKHGKGSISENIEARRLGMCMRTNGTLAKER